LLGGGDAVQAPEAGSDALDKLNLVVALRFEVLEEAATESGKAFRLERCLPSGVRGPVELWCFTKILLV
jgi:hypothetical protein